MITSRETRQLKNLESAPSMRLAMTGRSTAIASTSAITPPA